MKKIILVFLFILFLTGCSTKPNDSFSQFQNDKQLKRWVDFYHVNPNKFKYSGKEKYDVLVFSDRETINDKFFKVISKKSENSNYSLNIFGYTEPLFNKSIKKWELGFGDGMAIFLYSENENKLFRINYVGTPVIYEDFGWIDNNKFYILGIETDEDTKDKEMKVLFIEVFNIENKDYEKYIYNMNKKPEKYYDLYKKEVIGLLNSSNL